MSLGSPFMYICMWVDIRDVRTYAVMIITLVPPCREEERRSRAVSDPKLVVPPQVYSGYHRPSLGGEVERPKAK